MKRRSGTSGDIASPPETFFVDRDLGPTVARILRAAGLKVRSHNEIFREATAEDAVADAVWLRHTAERGWIALTRDKNIRRSSDTVREIMEHGARLFILRGALRFPELAQMFLEGLPKLRRFLNRNPGPFIAGIRRSTLPGGGSSFVVEIVMYLSYEEWKSVVR